MGEGAAIARQRKECRVVAKLRGWTVVDEFPDNDTSASGSAKRPGFEGLLDAIRSRRIKVVLAWDMSRLTRNPRDTLRILEVGKEYGIRLAFAQGTDLNLASADGRTMASLLAAFAQGEIDKKGERHKARNYDAAVAGVPIYSRRPFGYTPRGEGMDRRSVQVAKEVAALRSMRRDLIAGKSLGHTARRLNEAGLRTTTGREFDRVAIRQILLNPVYAGLAVYDGKVVGQGTWKAVWSEDEYDRIVQLLNAPGRSNVTNTGVERKWLMSGVAVCGKCGGVMMSGGKTGLYRCRPGKGHVARRVDLVDPMVERIATFRLFTHKHPLTSSEPDPKVLRQRDELRKRRDALARMLANGLLDPDAVQVQAAKLTAQLEALPVQVEPSSTKFGALVRGERAWGQATLGERRELMRALGMRVVILPLGRSHAASAELPGIRVEWPDGTVDERMPDL